MGSRTPAPSPAVAGASPMSSTPSAKSTTDPILRNALRYTISAREYSLLHRYVLSRSRLLKRRVPAVETVHRVMDGQPYNRARGQFPSATDRCNADDMSQSMGRAPRSPSGGAVAGGQRESVAGPAGDDYNARAIRHSIRVFVATGAAMKLWALLSNRLTAKSQR